MRRMVCGVILAATLAGAAGARGAAEDGAADGRWVRVTGVVRVVGNIPFTELVISDVEGRDWFVAAEWRAALEGCQGREVTVRGRLFETELTLADGARLGTRRELRDVRILGAG